jgi:hypothetical protein
MMLIAGFNWNVTGFIENTAINVRIPQKQRISLSAEQVSTVQGLLCNMQTVDQFGLFMILSVWFSFTYLRYKSIINIVNSTDINNLLFMRCPQRGLFASGVLGYYDDRHLNQFTINYMFSTHKSKWNSPNLARDK